MQPARRDLAFLSLSPSPDARDADRLRAKCISEGLEDRLAWFSWQLTNYSGMDAEVHPHVGVTESSQPSRCTQVESETPADSLKSYWHLVI